MKYLFFYFFFILSFASCTNQIKDTNSSIIEEEGTKIDEDGITKKSLTQEEISSEYIGFWVGYFEPDNDEEIYEKMVHVDEGYSWNRENKINIIIQKIEDNEVTGRSVIAGNNRPFKGTVKNNAFQLKEPGDDKYDGEFKFEIKNQELTGKWSAYKKIDISKRKYTLEKKEFHYNKDIQLEKAKEYVNWNSFKSEKISEEYEGEIEEWISKEFSTATEMIYKLNASSALLTKKQVENLKKGDLSIIRNAIYARHGYSFKNRPLRVFFDAQSWYVPMSTDIKSDLTALEKENIKLLMRYEKNASEYYDYFGRG